MVLKARSSTSVSLDGNQGVCQEVLPLEALEEKSFLASTSFLWLLVVLGALWLRESLPQGLPPWSHRPLPHVIPLGLYVLSPLRILVTGFRAHLVNPG